MSVPWFWKYTPLEVKFAPATPPAWFGWKAPEEDGKSELDVAPIKKTLLFWSQIKLWTVSVPCVLSPPPINVPQSIALPSEEYLETNTSEIPYPIAPATKFDWISYAKTSGAG